MKYIMLSLVTAIVAAAAAGICATLGWPVWAMFLGWVAALTAGYSLKEVSRGYVCLLGGTVIGALGTLAAIHLGPIIGSIAAAPVVFGMATFIVSMRKMPYANITSNYILGVVGVFALQSSVISIAPVKIAAPAAVGAVGVWLAGVLRDRL